ncbi:MAG: MqnA/MqnD/SBP family protein [Alistipes indistinctus]
MTGECDAGVLIHEGRFVYRKIGLQLVADLGVEWERLTGLPLPLGAIVVSRRLDAPLQRKIDRVLRRSIEYARANPAVSTGFVGQYAQELSEEVTRSHIELFVNDYSVDLGAEGRKAVTGLLGTETSGHKRRVRCSYDTRNPCFADGRRKPANPAGNSS